MASTTTQWLSLPGLLLLVATNSAPVVASWVAGKCAAWPLDCGAVLPDGERLLGANKTWRGLAAAILAGAALAAWLAIGPAHGAAAGAATTAGDALSSFVKRRLRLRPGTWVPLLDQLPEAALPLLVAWRTLALGLGSFLGTILAFCLLDLVASKTLGSSRRRRPTMPEPGPSAHPGGGGQGRQ